MSEITGNVELEKYYKKWGYRKRIFYLERYISILTSILDEPILIYGFSQPTIGIDFRSKSFDFDILQLVFYPGDNRMWRLYSISSIFDKYDLIDSGMIGDYTHFEETLKNISDQFFRVF